MEFEPNSGKLRIAETFSSIQGEGIWAGIPSYFIRVSGCNLRCKWCDTPYASWNPEGDFFYVEEIADEALATGIQHVVITGGEPMLFEPTVDLATLLKKHGKTITIETAGTVFRELPCDLMSISPKLAHSAPEGEWFARHQATRENLEPLRKLMTSYNFQLKFVVNPDDTGDNFVEIEALLNQLPATESDKILVMAEGTDAATIHQRERQILPAVIERGWRLCPRWHIDIFGNKRGT